MRTKKFAFQVFALFVIAATLLAACGGGAAPVAPEAPAAEAPAAEAPAAEAPAATEAPMAADPMADLVAACQKEGMVTIIATPASWANYGEIFEIFKKVSGVEINSLDENAGSADELAAIEANKGNMGPQAPDIVDVGYAYGQQGIDAGLYQPYKVSNWDAIPDTILGLPSKDPEGLWIGGYYGVMALEVNAI